MHENDIRYRAIRWAVTVGSTVEGNVIMAFAPDECIPANAADPVQFDAAADALATYLVSKGVDF